MSLVAGTRLGPYEIADQIGAGGMGEVYRATDTRLDRTVAIKVLPEHLADDPQRRVHNIHRNRTPLSGPPVLERRIRLSREGSLGIPASDALTSCCNTRADSSRRSRISYS